MHQGSRRLHGYAKTAASQDKRAQRYLVRPRRRWTRLKGLVPHVIMPKRSTKCNSKLQQVTMGCRSNWQRWRNDGRSAPGVKLTPFKERRTEPGFLDPA